MIVYQLKEIIKAKKILNISQMADELGMYRNTLNRVVNNTIPGQVDTETLEKLCRMLNVTPNDLLKIVNEDGTEWKPEPVSPLLNEKFYVSSKVKSELHGRPE